MRGPNLPYFVSVREVHEKFPSDPPPPLFYTGYPQVILELSTGTTQDIHRSFHRGLSLGVSRGTLEEFLRGDTCVPMWYPIEPLRFHVEHLKLSTGYPQKLSTGYPQELHRISPGLSTWGYP